jgi:TolB-like protein/Flp pilus assembly protein TadD
MKNLIREIHARSLWQVLGIYLVGSWIALQVVDVLANNFGLPEWFPAFALALLVLGLPIVLATAFVQEGVGSGSGDGGARAGVDPSILPAPGPQLFTWRNALMGGAAASVVWGAVALGWFAFRSTGSGAEVAIGDELRQSIAVLPFAARSATESEETDFFAEGMHDDLLTQLSKIEGLTVISRTSVMQFRETEMAIPEIANELGVANVLEGAVDRAGDRIRVNVQLIEAETDRHLWAETYDEAFTAANVFAIRADLSRKIATALHATLSPSVDAELASAPTESLEAYDLHSRGRFVLSTRGATREGVENAIELHRRAIEVDPEYAPAYAGLAQAYWAIWNLGYLSDDEALPPAREAADRALALDPNLADAHVADAHLLDAEFRRAEAKRAVERALELSPGNARALSLYSSVLLGEADMEGSVATARRAVEVDPLSVEIRRSLVSRLAWAGLHEEAILEAERLLELDPREADGHYYIGVALDGQGRFEDAIAAYERAIEINPEDPYYPAAVAYSHAMLGNQEQAVVAAEQARAAGVPLKELALVYSAMGDMDTAFEWLARAAATEPGTLSTLDADPTSDALRGDPRYEKIMAPLRSN